MRPILPLLALLVLVACGPKPVAAPPAPPAPEPQAQVTDFSRDMVFTGTEPFWSVTQVGMSFTLIRPDHPDLVAIAPGAMIVPGRAEWNAATGQGETMNLTVYVSPCSDGMSDRSYPMTAEVAVGGETLRGCAAPVGSFDNAPRP